MPLKSILICSKLISCASSLLAGQGKRCFSMFFCHYVKKDIMRRKMVKRAAMLGIPGSGEK